MIAFTVRVLVRVSVSSVGMMGVISRGRRRRRQVVRHVARGRPVRRWVRIVNKWLPVDFRILCVSVPLGVRTRLRWRPRVRWVSVVSYWRGSVWVSWRWGRIEAIHLRVARVGTWHGRGVSSMLQFLLQYLVHRIPVVN